jgi:hypothetical protein
MVDKTKKPPVNKTVTGKPVDHKIDINPQLKKENVIELDNDGVAIPPSDTIVERKALTIQQRQARARILQRIEPKLQRAREVAKKKIATDAQLKNRAMIKARDLLKKRLAARRDVDYADLSTSEKIQVDKAVEKKVALIKKIAQRLLPIVRKAEYDRIKSFISGAKLQDLSTPATIVQSYENDFDLEDLTETIIETFDVIDEAIDNKNVDILLRAGLADRKNLQKYRRAAGNMDDSLKNPQYRDYLLKILRKLMEIVTNDVNIFSRTRAILQKKKLSENALISLQKKAEKYNVPLDVAVEVYARGVDQWETNSITEMTYEQYGFSRLNSFLNGGKATELDIDLVEYVDTYNPLNASETIAPRIRNLRSKRESARSSGNDIASTARPHKSYTSNRFTHKKYISSEYDMELDNNFSDFINEAKNSPKQREIGTTSLRKIYTKDTPCQEENDIDNAFSVSEEIKGWKNAASDIAKWRSEKGKNIKMVRLKNDGGESKLSDATTLHGSEEDAVERHDRMTKSNPSKKIKHNLYVDGKLVRTLGEDVELDESVYEYSLKKTGMKQTIAHPDGKPTYDLHYNGEKVATIAPYSGHRDKKNPGSRIVTSRKNITSYSINFEKDKGPQGYHKGYFSSQFTNYDNPKKAHESAVELHSKWKKEKVNEDVELDEMSGANMDRRSLVSDITKRGWTKRDSGGSGDHEVYFHPNSSKKLAVPRHNKLKAPLVLNILKQSKIMDKKVNEEIVHDKCGTSDCCNQCDTSINESFTMAFDYFSKPSYAPTASDLMMKAKGGYETHPDVEIVETVNAIRERIVSTFDRYVLTEGEDYEGKMARGELNALIKKAQSLIGKFQDDNKEIDAWVQAKITKAADYINSVHDYLTNSKQDVDEAAKSADKEPVVVPAHKDAYGNTIPAKTVMRRKNTVIVNAGDNPNDGK